MHTLYDLIHAQGIDAPESTAVADIKNERITYGNLVDRLNCAIADLKGLGITSHDRVAIVLPNGIDLAVTFLAVASVTAAAPLNPAYSLDEFSFYLSDLRPRALITTRDIAPAAVEAASGLGVPVL